MAIRIEQPGAAKAAAQTGALIGKGKRAQEERARTERGQARAEQIAAQQAARKVALQWEQEKMRMRSEQDFQQELAAKQWDYEKFNRAKAWQIEKMEMASRLDFQQEEKERAEKKAKIAAGVKAIDESTDIYLTPEAKEKAKEEFLFKQEQGYYPPRPSQEQKQSVLGLLGGDPTPEPVKGVQTFIDPETKEPIYVPEGQPFVTVQHPTLGLKKIRREQLQEALAEGSIYIPQQAPPQFTGRLGTGAERGSFGGMFTPEEIAVAKKKRQDTRQREWEEAVRAFRAGEYRTY